MTTLIQIPALSCEEGLYAPFNTALGQQAQTIIPLANRMVGCVEEVLAQAPDEFILLGTSLGERMRASAAPVKMADVA